MKMKWECACGEQFTSKKKCEDHIKEVHWEFIRTTCGLASLRYHPRRIE